jgi:hypothetical protein
MARRLYCTAGLTTILWLAVGGWVHAQIPFCITPPSAYALPPVVGPVGGPSPLAPGDSPGANGSGTCANGVGGDGATIGHGHPLREAIESHLPVGCWAHHNMFGCGSFRSEMNFIYGSCRSFYGQSCLKEPPPDALAPMREGTPEAANPPRFRLPFGWCPSCR